MRQDYSQRGGRRIRYNHSFAMFDLFRSRDKSVRFLLGAILILVSLSMLTYLIPNYNSGGRSGDMVVAEIGKETVTLPEVQRTVQATARQRSIPPEIMPHYVRQLIDSLITEHALAYEAQRLGYQVSDADIATAIRSLIPQLFPDGKFIGKDAYAAMLAQQNTTIPEFESNLARQLLITRLREIALEGTVIPPTEIEQEYRRRNEKAKLEYVKLTPEKYRSEVQVSPEEMRTYYNASRARYQIAAKRSLGLLVLDQAKLAESLTPTDVELQRLYNQDKERFRKPERVKARHILLKTTGKSKAEESAIKAKAEDLLKQIKGGADFAELARKHSEDTSSAPRGGELPDWVTRGQTVPEFENAAFSLKPGETSGLVKTEYGYHIIQVLAKEPARLKPFEEVKTELAGDYKKQRVNDVMQQLADKAQAALTKDPQHPEKVAAELNLQFASVEKVAPGDPLPEIGVSRDFEESVASLKKGEVSQPVLVPGNKLVVAVVTNVFPAHPASFEEAQPQVREILLKEKLEKLVAQRANELYEKAKSLNGDLKKAAASMDLELKSSADFTRQGAVEGLGSASYVPDAFTKPAGSLFGPVSLPEGKVICKVLSRVEPNMADLPAQRIAIRDELKSKRSNVRNALFEDGVRQALIKEGKIKIHQDVVDRLIANYRG